MKRLLFSDNPKMRTHYFAEQPVIKDIIKPAFCVDIKILKGIYRVFCQKNRKRFSV